MAHRLYSNVLSCHHQLCPQSLEGAVADVSKSQCVIGSTGIYCYRFAIGVLQSYSVQCKQAEGYSFHQFLCDWRFHTTSGYGLLVNIDIVAPNRSDLAKSRKEHFIVKLTVVLKSAGKFQIAESIIVRGFMMKKGF